ncbi:hypothetical protein C0Q70_01419 [Pomacea canaliculata]|uniref:Uncharacterized protein n=1 Tax=Pomacea canaliculata TaxID=400727 RepID=A0A2T7PZE0_POMCA|nr:hypothetical protein C0Q70_01419 [Pomacea canaliculata]
MWRKAWTGGAGAFSRWPPCPSLSVSRPHGARPNCLALDTKRPGCEPSGTVMDGGCHRPLCTKTPPAHFVGCAPCTCFPSASTIDQILTFLVSPVVCETDHRVWQQGLVRLAPSGVLWRLPPPHTEHELTCRTSAETVTRVSRYLHRETDNLGNAFLW